MPSQSHLVYALSDPRSGEIRYVGKSSSGMRRPSWHLSESHIRRDRTRKGSWLKSLLALGQRAQIEVIEECESLTAANESEKFWISQLRSLGFRLTNLTDGGDGAPGRVMTDEHKRKIAATAMGNKRMLGKRLSVESRAKISRSQSGEGNSVAKLSSVDAERMRKMIERGDRQKDVAALFGVGRETVRKVSRGERWAT